MDAEAPAAARCRACRGSDPIFIMNKCAKNAFMSHK
jgi:hypothetical protein